VAARLVVAGALLLSACQRDYSFRTVAVYEAPRGHYSIRIESEGVVRAGHDISQQSVGLLTVSPSRESGAPAPVPFTLRLALRGSRVHFGDDLPVEGAPPESGAPLLSRLLSDGGYGVYADELDELVSATEGVLLGPKGTLLSGQSRCLRVVSTRSGSGP
jgi:hypothetical protein